ncbi:MAG: CDP-glucose 4,6-dehydratase [Lachnospiraceae bacterium]|nr:CDP-glucose 4,6-dehydratase [Lachnospiraceae bacterium]
MNFKESYKNRKILITGHTGFKGSWMIRLLYELGADVYGYSLDAPTEPSLFKLIGLDKKMGEHSRIADIRDLKSLSSFMTEVSPDIVIHMAAQPIVRTSYADPVGTYETNVMGTVNVLEAVRQCPSVKSVVNVTTDKVYLNRERDEGYREDEELKGYDPYSNSKSCSELVTYSYVQSFFKDSDKAVSTMRAGNVIGGGDFAKDRLIPDCVRAVAAGEPIVLRNPDSVRPYQHVLEPVYAYLYLAAAQLEDKSLAGNYNVGPEESDCLRTIEMAELFASQWNKLAGSYGNLNRAVIECRPDGGPHEAKLLKLDCTKIKAVLGRKPRWDSTEAVKKTVEWAAAYVSGADADAVCAAQIAEYSDS